MSQELPKRKHTRLKGYDYSQNGYYFITICTYNRKHLFGQIVGSIHESTESPRMELNAIGIIVESMIKDLPRRFLDIYIDHYVIMPNHMHMVVVISGERVIRESPLQKRPLLSQVVGYLKMNTTKQIRHGNKDIDVWQGGYHDHIIRNEETWEKILEYIQTNPLKWEEDKYYT